jgi:hypothetical protein
MLLKNKKIWEKYRKEIIIFLIILIFSYNNFFYMIELFYLFAQLFGQRIRTNTRIIIYWNRTTLIRKEPSRNNIRIRKDNAGSDFHL